MQTPRKTSTLNQLSEILPQTLATLVLYNTSLENSLTFKTLSQSLVRAGLTMDLLVYDNSLNVQKMPTSDLWHIHYVHDPDNGGVSKAYNTGFGLAKEKGKKWLLLLDQDTEYTSSTFDEYADSLAHYPDQTIFIPRLYDAVGIVSPFTFRFGGGQRVINLTAGVHSLLDFKFHNCGLLISTTCFEKANGYDEHLPLDFSDLSFIKRLQKLQSTFVATTIVGFHQLASTAPASGEERLVRFKSYCKSCRYYQKMYDPANAFIMIRLAFRGIKLSLQHRSFGFISALLTQTR